MKIIFISPFNPLWSDQLSELAVLLDASVMSIGDLLRDEVKKESALGIEIKCALQSGDIIDADLSSRLVVERFFLEPGDSILKGFPINKSQADALSGHIKAKKQSLDAIVVVDINKEQLTDVLVSNSYDLTNDKVSYLIDSFYKEKTGVLAAAQALAKALGSKYISFLSPLDAKGQLNENV
tara:strand:- start:93 stop:635 length:543 start_codon:yes stop_codon:yes gene_type:complete